MKKTTKIKRIKGSRRGLTFVSEHLHVGRKFCYMVDIHKKEVHIIENDTGKNTVSRKRCGSEVKPLIDIRSSEIKALVSSAAYLLLEIQADGSILVKVFQKARERRSNVVSLQEILGTQTGEFVILPKMLAVAGGTYPTSLFGKATLADDAYFEYLNSSVYSKCRPKKKDIQKVYDVISLFSGAGMFDKAFLDNRFRFVYGVDFEQAAVNTYRENIGTHIECRDIRAINPQELPKADLIIGGPCCQAYSNANRHNIDSEEAEEKRLLIDDYARIVKAKRPKVWVVENVPELMTKESGFYLNRLLNALSDYEVTATIIADDEVGGYSVRRRAIIIGSIIGKIKLPELKVMTAGTVRDALSKVDATWFNFNDVTQPREDTKKKMSFIPQGGNWKNIPAPYNTYGPDTHSCIMRRLEWNKPSITLCNFRKANILHPEENRILTVSEAAAIMGLEKDFKFIGKLAEKQQMVSNGVTQAVGRLVRNTVLKALDASNIVCFA